MAPISLTEAQQQALLALAKASIKHGLAHGVALPINLEAYPEEMRKICATFVTLEIGQQLRGCIGMLEAIRPLVLDISENAFAAAFRDRRFPPLSAAEFPRLELHLSLLSAPEAIRFSSEADLLKQLRPHVDGLIMREGGRCGTFLPAVWDSLPQPEAFIQHLKQKTGLPQYYWSDTLKISRYTCQVIA